MPTWLSTAALLLAPLPASSEGREDEVAIRALIDRFVDNFNAGDAESAVLVYADPHVDANARVPVESRQKTAEKYNRLFERFDVTLRVTSDEIVVAGDWAFQRGEFEQGLTPKTGGEPQTFTRRYVEVLKRQPDGSWLVYWRLDAPREGAP